MSGSGSPASSTSRLRTVAGVQKVDLKTSQRQDNAAGGAGGGSAYCPGKKPPSFTVSLTFGAPQP